MNQVLTDITALGGKIENVKINLDETRRFSQGIKTKKLTPWLSKAPIRLGDLSDKDRIGFLFVLNSISFSYWGKPKWTIGEGFQRGAWSMATALERAKRERIDIFDPQYLAEISQDDLTNILRGNTKIPLLRERKNILNEVGRKICERYCGSFANFIDSANGDALKFVDRLTEGFDAFKDTSFYKGKTFHFNKRAQLLASDLSNMVGVNLKDSDKLTACADYILPMVLRYKGVIDYSSKLASKVDKGIEISRGSGEETEIRVATILAVEKIKEFAKRRMPKITSMQINDYIWLEGNQIPSKVNYHKTRTTAY